MNEQEQIRQANRQFKYIDDLAIALGTSAISHRLYGFNSLKNYILKNYDKESIAKIQSKAMFKINQNNKLITATSSRGFDDVFKKILAQKNINLSKKKIKQIARLKSVMLAEMNVPNRRLRASIKKALLLNQTKGKTQRELLEAISEYSPKSFKRHVSTVFNSTLQRTYGQASWESVKDQFEWFIYSGVKDSRNRSFCSHHANNVFTASEAAKIQQKRSGFYRCRHFIIAFTGTNEEAKSRRGKMDLSLKG